MKLFNVLAPLFLSMHIVAQERAEWMPEEAAGGREADGGERIQLPVTWTELPKKTADISRFSRVYIVDTEKFNIYKDGTNPESTVKVAMVKESRCKL